VQRDVSRPRLHDLVSLRVAAMLALGFSSGLPFLLSGGTLQAWLKDAEVPIETIGLFSLVGLPYALKFLWAPLMDSWVPLGIGRRRAWMAVTQVGLVLGIGGLGLADPASAPWLTAGMALVLAFMGASQDIALDAYRTDTLSPAERGPGVALWTIGYRLAMIVSGGLALLLADRVGWTWTYLAMAALMLLGLGATAAVPEDPSTEPPRGFYACVVEPLADFFRRFGVQPALMLLFALFYYKLCDSYAASLGTPFLRDLGFSNTDIGIANKVVGFIATLVGVAAGGLLVVFLGLYRSLLVLGALQIGTNLLFVWQAQVGKDFVVLYLVVCAEKFAGGLGDVPFVALMMALCNARFTAFQYALLSSVPAIGRYLLNAQSGYMVEAIGWELFYLTSFGLGIPALGLVVALRSTLRRLELRPGAILVD
jgi:PAT family beta-lactamase induction signal transducer AmpG